MGVHILLTPMAAASPSAESAAALQLLQVLLTKISRLDTDMFYQEPVTEAMAPGYFEVTVRPIARQLVCFPRDSILDARVG